MVDSTMASSESVDLGGAIYRGIDTTSACLGQLVLWWEPLLGGANHSLVKDGWCWWLLRAPVPRLIRLSNQSRALRAGPDPTMTRVHESTQASWPFVPDMLDSDRPTAHYVQRVNHSKLFIL